MAISGRATAVHPSFAADALRTRRRASAGWTRVAVACCIVAALATGCASPSVKLGNPPATDRLAELTVGVSTAKDVVAVLGEPQGRGAARAQEYGFKETWLYESAEIAGSNAKMRMLMLFFDKDTGVYQGHLWFASGLLFGRTQ